MGRLMRAVNVLDGRADAGESPLGIVQDFADPASVEYMAEQRALRAHLATGVPAWLVQAVWLDAFALGCQFANEQASTDLA